VLPLRPSFNPTTPIPNSPFYSPLTNSLNSLLGPLVVGSGLNIDFATSTLSSTGGGGGGAVNQVTGGTGISVSPTTGNVVVTNTGVTSLIAGANITLSGATGAVTISATGGGSGCVGTVTSITAGTGLTGGTITTAGTIALNTTCVVKPTDFTAKGDVLVGTGASAYTALGVGGNCSVLTANSACVAGVEWVVPPVSNSIPCSVVTGKGAIVTGTATSTPFALPLGANGELLYACSTAATGLCWASAPASTAIPCACLTAKGVIITAAVANTPTALTVGADNQVLFACSAATTGLCWATPCQGTVTGVTGTLPITVSGSANAPVVNINGATTSQTGAVQLYDNTDSTSTALALTAAQGKNLQDQINSLTAAGSTTLAGTFDANAGVMLTVTSAGTAALFAVGSNLPVAGPTNADYFVIVTTEGSYSPPGGGGPYAATQGDWFLSNSTSWQFLNVGPAYPYATTTAPGIVCLSTNALAQGGSDTTTALTPATAASAYIFKSCITNKGSLITGTAASTPTALTVGSDGQVLTACSTATSGLCWAAASVPAIPCSIITAKGDLIAGTSSSTPVALAVGANGQVLMADSTSTSGVKWNTGMGDTPIGSVQFFAMNTAPSGWLVADGSAVSRTTYVDLFNAIGTVYGTGDGVNTFNLPDLKGQFLRGWNSTGTGCDASRVFGSTQQSAFAAHCHQVQVVGGGAGRPEWLFPNNACPSGAGWPSPTGGAVRTAGFTDLTGGTETRPVNVAMLPCIKWQLTTAPSSCGIPCSCITAKGVLITGTAANTPIPLPAGTDNQVLIACAACATGLTWSSPTLATPTIPGIILGCTDASNAALGCNALAANTTGSGNVAIGLNALCSNSIGVNNVFIGNCAGKVVAGSGSVGIGTSALLATTNGGRNVALGEATACSNVSGECITAVGWNALSTTTGGCNTALGYCAGSNITTGGRNVIIGPGASALSATGSCQLAIGFSAGCNWLTGDCNKNIRPGAGIIDCTGLVGPAGTVLCSTGSVIQWAVPAVFTPGPTALNANPTSIIPTAGWTQNGASPCDAFITSPSTGWRVQASSTYANDYNSWGPQRALSQTISGGGAGQGSWASWDACNRLSSTSANPPIYYQVLFPAFYYVNMVTFGSRDTTWGNYDTMAHASYDYGNGIYCYYGTNDRGSTWCWLGASGNQYAAYNYIFSNPYSQIKMDGIKFCYTSWVNGNAGFIGYHIGGVPA